MKRSRRWQPISPTSSDKEGSGIPQLFSIVKSITLVSQDTVIVLSFLVLAGRNRLALLIGAFADVLSGPHYRFGNGIGAGSGPRAIATLTTQEFQTNFTP